MKRIIITHQTGNPTPCRTWDYVAHFEGECEGPEHNDAWGEGATPQDAIYNFMEQFTECGKCEELINNNNEMIERHSCGKPYFTCLKCEGI